MNKYTFERIKYISKKPHLFFLEGKWFCVTQSIQASGSDVKGAFFDFKQKSRPYWERSDLGLTSSLGGVYYARPL